MIGASERRSAEFLKWEARGRGFLVWPHPVWPEPPFEPFGLRRDEPEAADDGRKPTFLSSAIRRLSQRLAPSPRRNDEPVEDDKKLPPEFTRESLVELQAHLPSRLEFDASRYTALFTSLSVCAEPVTFELVATDDRMTAQFAVHPKDERLARRQFASFIPNVPLVPARGLLEGAWGDAGELHAALVEFGLGKEFMVPFQAGRSDPFVGLVGALSEIEKDEVSVFQVIFAPVSAPWEESIIRSVTHGDGSAMFINAPELLPGAKEKTAERLFAAVVRIATRSPIHGRAWEIALNIGGALGAYGSARGNELVPLSNDGYPVHEHELDFLARQTRRSGMLLNARELVGFAHLPSSDVLSPLLRKDEERTKAAPQSVRDSRGLRLGVNRHAGVETPVHLPVEARVRHVHVIGASGTGKSSLLYNLISQGIERGEGVSVLDPHGDLIDRILGAIPEHRASDVVLLDPSDEQSVVGFNILSAHSDAEKNQLASDLVAVFRRLSSAWGDQLNSVLSNALLAFMESERGGTLLELRRFLLEPTYRNEFLSTVRDSNVVYYWCKAFPALTGNKSVGPVVTRLDTFLSPKAVRYMVGQKANRLDFGDIMDSGKIFLAKLSHGAIGKENSHLLGSLLVAKIQAEAMRRQKLREAERRHHFLYADEFHDFLTPSLAECLSGARKYRLGLVLAHQEMRQVERDSDVASALLGAGTRVVFRVNDRDAKSLESGFSAFEARDIQNLETGHAICRVERSDADFNLSVDAPSYAEEHAAHLRCERIVALSRERYGTPRNEIEQLLAKAAEVEPPAPKSDPRPDARPAPVDKHTAPPEAAPPPETAKVEPLPPAPAPPEPKKEERPAAPVADLGRGGAQHKAIQDRIKDGAEKIGFRVSVEKEVLDGAGNVDLVLARDNDSIACEVTVTTTIDHEVGNVAKCFKAGFARIALVAGTEERAEKLRVAVVTSFGEEKAKCVGCYVPDSFLAYLRDLPRAAPLAPVETRSRGGRVVKRALVPVSPEEAKAKEEQMLKIMAETMKKKKQK
jgi:hypothetical protein